MPKSKPQPRGVTSRGGRLVREPKTSREARRAAERDGTAPSTFFERRAAADPSIDHSSHSLGWAGGCGECPSDVTDEEN